ncbi:MAG TPA: patatin-like phospholipase family protein [Gallionellaceae bacterium]|nr:patatin-like phospholipase family protein [Gallionellaceae bacterium]
MEKPIGLILTGGGARAAYQVGVLKAIADILPRNARNPFPIISGTSAGALNAATLAVNAGNFRLGVQYLLSIWQRAQVEQIYRADPVGVLVNTARWLSGLVLSSLGSNRLNHVSLLDNTPMNSLLEEILPYDKIQHSIDSGHLHALSITASGYTSEQSVTFFQGVRSIQPWHRARRLGIPARIESRHLQASAAIPFLFPAVRINREYFGDGSMRQIAPISSALHLGAKRVLVIGVGQSSQHPVKRRRSYAYPSLAQIAGHALNSIFLDSLELDLERLRRINHTVSLLTEEQRNNTQLHHIDVLVIQPSESIERIAQRHASKLPWPIRFLLRLIGAMRRSGANLVSYLLFDRQFCRALIDLGYQDAMRRREEILALLTTESPTADSQLPQ